MTSGYLVRAGAVANGERFPFTSWASANRFAYPLGALPLLERCGSAAEAYFAREFAEREGFAIDPDGRAGVERVFISPQVPCGTFRIDFVVRHDHTALAIEIDGMAFHHRSREQVAADYLRQRRIVARGYTVIRFTAPEVFASAAECWRQVDAILAARGLR